MVNLTRKDIFPTPVYEVFLEDHELLNVYLGSRLYSWRKRDRNGTVGDVGGYMGVWQSVNTMHEMREFELFNNQIRRCIDDVIKDQGGDFPGKLWCTGMCAQISDRFGYDQSLPEHSNGWHGVYFVQSPVDSGAIEFQNPRMHDKTGLTSSMQGGRTNVFHDTREIAYDAIAGRVLLFPSWLGYRMQPNRSQLKGGEGERISIRFAFGVSEAEIV